MKMRKGVFALGFAGAMALAGAAEAHTGAGATTGAMHGFFHPLGGLDHLLAMVSVGLFAFLLGGRALWLVPLSFVAMMAAGGVAGMEGVGIPFVETGIALSVIVIGGLVALGRSLPLAAAMSVVGAFALFHGYAHGAEMPLAASGLGYGAGFLSATAALHSAGVGLGVAAAGLSDAKIMRTAGALVSAAGIALIGGAF